MLLIYRNIFIKIINKIWERKLLIFLTSFTFSLLTYLFSLTITKKYSAMFILKKPPSNLFLNYQSLEHGYNFINILENKIEQNHYNIVNTIEFIDQSIEFERFKEFLKLKNITIEDYFKKNKIQFAIDKHGNYRFSLIYLNNEIDGNLFLKNYLKYITNISIDEVKQLFQILIEKKINTNIDQLNNIQPKKNLYLEKLKSNDDLKSKDDLKSFVEFKFLEEETNIKINNLHLNDLRKKLTDDNFDYEILKDISPNKNISNNASISYSLLGLIFGLFLSLTFILLRN